MKIQTINKYICSYCGDEFDDDERQKCEEHEKECRENYIMMAYRIKRMCERLIENNCNECPFRKSTKDGNECILINYPPKDWKVKPSYD